ncbi:MAG: hypothetical protein PVG96_04810 [Desulfobacterales bacterium]|jgi:hypothetical protein
MEKLKIAKWKILTLLLVAGLGLMAAYFEPAISEDKSCLEIILGSPKFIVFFAIVLIICFVTALNKRANTKFFIWLLVLGFFIGLITQIVGTTSRLWTYQDSFVFIGFSWALAAVTMLGLSILIEKLLPEINGKRYNVLGLIVLVFAILIFLDEFRTKVLLSFWIYYIALFFFAVVTTYHMRCSTLLSLFVAAWIMGLVSEYMGSSIGLWKFCPDLAQSGGAEPFPCWSPPPYLILGCWPLEFIAQVGLSSFISGQNILLDQQK